MKPETRNKPGRKRCAAINKTRLMELDRAGDHRCCRQAVVGDYCYQHGKMILKHST